MSSPFWPGICNVTLQDCTTRYPSLTSPQYEDGSCVLDARRGEPLGTCGWVGAKCSQATVGGVANCAGYDHSTNLCRNGQCAGGVGDACSNYADCLYRINCNGTYCGGDGADFFPLGDNSDPPVPRVYCISDTIHIGTNQQTSCGPSPTGTISLYRTGTSSLPTGTITSALSSTVQNGSSNTSTVQSGSFDNSHSLSIGPLVGGIIGGIITLVLLITAFLCWRRSRRSMERVDDLIKDEPNLVHDLPPEEQPNPTIPSYSPLAQELLTPTPQSPITPRAASSSAPLPPSAIASDFEQRLIELQYQSVRARDDAAQAQNDAARARDEAERTRLEAERTLAEYRAREGGESAAGDVPPPYTFE